MKRGKLLLEWVIPIVCFAVMSWFWGVSIFEIPLWKFIGGAVFMTLGTTDWGQ